MNVSERSSLFCKFYIFISAYGFFCFLFCFRYLIGNHRHRSAGNSTGLKTKEKTGNAIDTDEPPLPEEYASFHAASAAAFF